MVTSGLTVMTGNHVKQTGVSLACFYLYPPPKRYVTADMLGGRGGLGIGPRRPGEPLRTHRHVVISGLSLPIAHGSSTRLLQDIPIDILRGEVLVTIDTLCRGASSDDYIVTPGPPGIGFVRGSLEQSPLLPAIGIHKTSFNSPSFECPKFDASCEEVVQERQLTGPFEGETLSSLHVSIDSTPRARERAREIRVVGARGLEGIVEVKNQ
jgi:hypothetical protein